MRVTVLFFGMLKDMVGRSQEDLELPEDARVGTVFDHYASQFPRLGEMGDSIVLARNQEFSDPEAKIGEGDEIALMPPVSGGSQHAGGGNDSPWLAAAEEEHLFCALTQDPIDAENLKRRALKSSDGAVITFEGVVRDNSSGRRTRYLDYDCYQALALRKMLEIGRDIVKNHAIDSVAMVHRLGRMEISETSVAIVVTSAHRNPAYEASLEAINRLKKLVPIWKKEYFEDGEVWVEGEWEEGVPRNTAQPA